MTVGSRPTPPQPDSASCFATSYAQARGKFIEAACAAGLAVQSHAHPLTGLEEEPLALDVVREGPDNAALQQPPLART